MNIRAHERHKKNRQNQPTTNHLLSPLARAMSRGQNLRILSPRRHPSRVGFAPTARRRPRPRRRRPRAVGARLRASTSSRGGCRALARVARTSRDRRARRIPRRRHIAGTRAMMMMDGAPPPSSSSSRRPRRADARATICVDMVRVARVRVARSRRACVPRVVRTTPYGWMDGPMDRCVPWQAIARRPRGMVVALARLAHRSSIDRNRRNVRCAVRAVPFASPPSRRAAPRTTTTTDAAQCGNDRRRGARAWDLAREDSCATLHGRLRAYYIYSGRDHRRRVAVRDFTWAIACVL